jgi:fatty acid desaturase
VTETSSNTSRIHWYRTPVDKALMARLNERSDAKGWLQCGGYAGLLLLTGGLSIYSFGQWPWWVTALLVFAHGSFFSTMSSAVHELIHRTVFKTRWLNDFWARVYAFFSWFSNAAFQPSHMLHHQFTLHQPDDLEVVLPIRAVRLHFLKYGIVAPLNFKSSFGNALRYARGHFIGEWEQRFLPESQPEKRAAVIRWGRTQIAGHALLILFSLAMGYWVYSGWYLLPALTTFGSCYGGWLIMLLGTPQHIGMQDETNDYRLCCRTYTCNPFFQFLYWHMNFHVEHHMYAAVPCYNLAKLHHALKHDLPPCPHGITATWHQIFEIQRRQDADPNYIFEPLLQHHAFSAE